MPVYALGISLMSCSVLSACESLRLYEGPRRPTSELAQIVGDTRLSGSLPVYAVVRRVDETELGLRYRGVWLLPGAHDLLIDCTVTESKRTSRHHLHVEVDAGVKYRIEARTAPGNASCAEVGLATR